MLAKSNRVSRPEDFRVAVRQGRRAGSTHTVVHVVDRSSTAPARFGFIVAKTVGGAVVRNRVRRRLRAACRDLLPTVRPGVDVVVRALPGSESAPWDTLRSEVAMAIEKSVSKG
ncbi:MAG: ribonuclease P protein component [Rhodoglobus sp.]